MLISKTRIVNVKNYLWPIPDGTKLKIANRLDARGLRRLEKIGFGPFPSDGETLLPRRVGRVSGVNSEGSWLIRRDQPKESRYIRTVSWKWKQWAGRGRTEDVEEFRDIFRDCYAREFIEPLALEISLVTRGEEKFAVITDIFTNEASQHGQIKHGINLMLELFGECEIVREDLTSYEPATLKRVNWRMLPPGEYPWAVVQGHLDKILHKVSENSQKVIRDRQEFLVEWEPSETYVGSGGFHDYIAYTFPSRGIVILESIRFGNALYVFGLNWQSVSQLSKAEILRAGYNQDRIIHTKGWKSRVRILLNPAQAAE